MEKVQKESIIGAIQDGAKMKIGKDKNGREYIENVNVKKPKNDKTLPPHIFS